MADIELKHARGGWQKKNHKYKTRKMVNGKWVYDYGTISGYGWQDSLDPQELFEAQKASKKQTKKAAADYNFSAKMNRRQKTGKLIKGGEADKYDWEKISKSDLNRYEMLKSDAKKYNKEAYKQLNKIKSEDRKKHNSKLHQAKVKYGATKAKVIRNINKGKKKVSELLSQIQKSYKSTSDSIRKKSKTKRKSNKNTIKLNKHQRVTFSDVKIK